MESKKDKSDAVMSFVNSIIGAYESGFVTKNNSNLADLYQCAVNHCKDNYGVDNNDIEIVWGKSLAIELKRNDN